MRGAGGGGWRDRCAARSAAARPCPSATLSPPHLSGEIRRAQRLAGQLCRSAAAHAIHTLALRRRPAGAAAPTKRRARRSPCAASSMTPPICGRPPITAGPRRRPRAPRFEIRVCRGVEPGREAAPAGRRQHLAGRRDYARRAPTWKDYLFIGENSEGAALLAATETETRGSRSIGTRRDAAEGGRSKSERGLDEMPQGTGARGLVGRGRRLPGDGAATGMGLAWAAGCRHNWPPVAELANLRRIGAVEMRCARTWAEQQRRAAQRSRHPPRQRPHPAARTMLAVARGVEAREGWRQLGVAEELAPGVSAAVWTARRPAATTPAPARRKRQQ